ncbi:MAG: universal stress protein [Gemmatimonadetes bacterium]|nr:universal stress protein [Gemmatimonadota bacterium]NNM07193.1 universal stress protein [Gemmatimonadota bacterium]
MLDQLLVTLDGSDFGDHALPFARAIAEKTGASVNLSHVSCCDPPTDLLQNTPFQYEGVSMEAYEEKHSEERREYLKGKADGLQKVLPGSKVDSTLLEGYVTEALERQANAIDAKMLIMTTHGRTGVSRAWLGSVADSLVRHSSFPLFVIRPLDDGESFPDPRFEHFLVPLDGSPIGEKILEPTVDLGKAMGARFTLLHVVAPYVTVGARVSPLPAGHLQERLEKAEEYLEGVTGRLRAQGLEAEPLIESHFAPARAILNTAEAQGVDLISIATHGYTGVKRALLGSVTDKVLRAARCPLLLERPSAD